MQKETLDFSVLLSSTNWGKLPQFSIWLDDHLFIRTTVGATPTPCNFSTTADYGMHELKIHLENKTPRDTVIADGKIVDDMLLNIDDISINGVSLGHLKWNSLYMLDQPQEYNGTMVTELPNCVSLGWNGAYVLKFSSPFYLWFLDSV